MSFDYDDNLIESKRKNTNPVKLTNLLLVAGFIVLAVLIVIFMKTPSDTLTEANVEATVDARLNEYIANQDSSENSEPAPTFTPSLISPPIEQRPVIEGTLLSAGKNALGTITDETFEINYTFDARAGIPYVITLQGQGLEFPELVLTNPSGNKIMASATADQPIGTTTTRVIGAVLPNDGQYTITVTRQGGRVGDTEGDFSLSLDIPPSLNSQSGSDGIISSNAWNWYIYQNADPFFVTYNHEAGDYKPDVGIYTLNVRSEFVTQGYLVGSESSYSKIGEFEPNVIHFIAIGKSTLQPNDETSIKTSSYRLGVQIAR
jgi:hypothetical protein